MQPLLHALCPVLFALSGGSAADDKLLAEIVGAQQRIDESLAAVEVTGTVTATCRGRVRFAPPVTARFAFSTGGSQWRLHIDGADIDQGGDWRDGRIPPHERLLRHYLVGGLMQTRDETKGTLRWADLKFKDPRYLYSICAPNEYVWSFAGTSRQVLFTQRQIEIRAVAGVAPHRTVTVASVDRPSGQAIVFEVVEEWGWLARRVTSHAAGAAAGRDPYRIEVHAVHDTVLGPFPARVTHEFWDVGQPGAASAPAPITLAEVTFDLPRFADVGADTDGGDADPLYADASFISGADVPRRARLMDALIGRMHEQVAGLDGVTIGPGTRRAAAVLFPWLLGASLACGIAAVIVRLAQRAGARRLSVAALLLGSCGLGMRSDVVATLASGPAEPKTIVPVPPGLKSSYLCGVDALFAALHGHVPDLTYPKVLRLVRPGRDGTTLAHLQVVADCLRAPAELVDLRDFATPPARTVCHVDQKHFVVVLGSRGVDAVVFDPGVGVVAQDWSSLRRRASSIGLRLTLQPAANPRG